MHGLQAVSMQSSTTFKHARAAEISSAFEGVLDVFGIRLRAVLDPPVARSTSTRPFLSSNSRKLRSVGGRPFGGSHVTHHPAIQACLNTFPLDLGKLSSLPLLGDKLAIAVACWGARAIHRKCRQYKRHSHRSNGGGGTWRDSRNSQPGQPVDAQYQDRQLGHI